MAKIGVAKAKQAKHRKYLLVRYGRMGTLGWFEHNEAQIPKVPHRVVVKTERGLELGQLVGQLCPYKAGHFKLSRDQVQKYFKDSEIDCPLAAAGRFVRYATGEDLSEERHLQKIAEEEMDYCKRFVKELNLAMKIVDAEHVFGGERLIFYFMSEGRVDFRQLVKKLAHEYQTRIEMRQIGSRDEAKLLADHETCGQECCCKRFLKALKPVNMRMAKMQKATLDPAKISGYCGRLKCCLRYEDQTYTELKKRLPKKNTKVKTRYGEGKVVDSQILTQLVAVELADGVKVAIPVEELEVVSSPPTSKGGQEDASDDESRNHNNDEVR
ncbi:MAG: PSP1 domain-containing protein [Planctomycetota bacterium]|jgi:cell fate regulator YaaT (PSP1 superfamily)